MFTVWCEWDIGLEGKIFATYEVAKAWAIGGLADVDVEDTFEALKAEGLIDIEALDVIYE